MSLADSHCDGLTYVQITNQCTQCYGLIAGQHTHSACEMSLHLKELFWSAACCPLAFLSFNTFTTHSCTWRTKYWGSKIALSGSALSKCLPFTSCTISHTQENAYGDSYTIAHYVIPFRYIIVAGCSMTSYYLLVRGGGGSNKLPCMQHSCGI